MPKLVKLMEPPHAVMFDGRFAEVPSHQWDEVSAIWLKWRGDYSGAGPRRQWAVVLDRDGQQIAYTSWAGKVLEMDHELLYDPAKPTTPTEPPRWKLQCRCECMTFRLCRDGQNLHVICLSCQNEFVVSPSMLYTPTADGSNFVEVLA